MILFIDCVWFEPQKLYTDRKGNEVWFGNRHQFVSFKSPPDVMVGTMTSDATFQYYLALEPPVVDPQSAELGFRKRFKKFFTFVSLGEANTVPYQHPLPLLWPELELEPTPGWDKRQDAVVAIMGNKFPHRLEALIRIERELAQHGVELHLYGRPGFDLPFYRGEIQGGAEAKRQVLSDYRYCYCSENSAHPFYMTEKLPEAILAGCLPLYYGASEAAYAAIPWKFVSTHVSHLVVGSEEEFHGLRDWCEDNFERLKHMMSRQRLYDLLLKECQP